MANPPVFFYLLNKLMTNDKFVENNKNVLSRVSLGNLAFCQIVVDVPAHSSMVLVVERLAGWRRTGHL